MYWVYVLKCHDDGFYVGCTENLKQRLKKHSCGYVNATKKRLSAILWQCHGFQSKYIAFNFEKYLKTASGRAFAIKHFSEHPVGLPFP